MKLRVKVLIYIILTTSIIFIASVGFINLRYWNYTKTMALRVANMYAKQSATTAKSILTADLNTVEALEKVLMSFNQFDKNTRTKFYQQILVDVLEQSPNFSAIWYNWELSAIDPSWTYPYGRERTQAFIYAGSVSVVIDSANLDGDVPGSEYYLMKSGVEESLLTDPYFYSYTQDTGSTILETSIAKGIYLGDQFVGAVGIDISLQRFQRLLSELKPFDNSKIIIISNNGTIVAFEEENMIGKKVGKVFPEYSHFKITDNVREGQIFNFSYTNSDEITEFFSFYPIKLEGSNMPWSLGFIVSNDVLIKDVKSNSLLLLIISAISLLIISFIIWFVLSIIVGPIEKTSKTLEALSKGNVSDSYKIKYSSKDELGRMAKATNILIDSLKRTQLFATEIGKGNLSTKYQLLSQNDVLGKSLVEMRNNLLRAHEEEKIRTQETQRLSWTQNGITEVNEILREHGDSIENLSSKLIVFLIKYTESVQGGLYLVESHEQKQVIVLKATHAYDRKKDIQAEIQIGEGLVGRSVKEKQKILIENLPEGYLEIRSGLGDKSPDNLIIIPLLFEDTVLGAIEIAGFNKFDEFKIQFLEQIAIRITSSVSVLLKNIETANLLKESQLQTATFEMKEKQFMRQRRKLVKKQNDLELESAQINVSLNALKHFGLYLEIDEDKTIIETNDYLPKIFHVEKSQIIGKKITDISKFGKSSKIWIEKFWEDIFKGDTRKKSTIYYWDKIEVRITDIYFIVKDASSDKIVIIGIK